MKKTHKILSIVIFILISVPALHHIIGFKVINPLNGAYVLTPIPEFNYHSVKKLEFQQAFEKYIEDHIGLRPQIIRLSNQINYSLFKEFNPNGVIVGEDNYLYEMGYINAKAGKDFIGSDNLRQIAKKIKYLEKKLNKNNIMLLIVLAPDKVTFFPEYLPKKYKDLQNTDSTNYKVFSKFLIQDSINHIDFNSLFLRWKDTSTYPLFPKYGIHWSTYGWTLAADTIIKRLEAFSSKKYNHFSIKEIELTTKLRDTDYDIGEWLNLQFKLPSHPMAYPKLAFDSVYQKPNILVIGDSFYKNIASSEIPKGIFQTHDFLFYNKRVYGNEEKKVKFPDDCKNYDFVIIEVTTPIIKLLPSQVFNKPRE